MLFDNKSINFFCKLQQFYMFFKKITCLSPLNATDICKNVIISVFLQANK